MMNLFSSLITHGGIRLDTDKSTTLRSRVMPTPLPKLLRINLRQADGLAATPIVSVGDKVLQFQQIAEPASEFGTPVHSPASGTVAAIEEMETITADDSTDLTLLLEVDAEQQSMPCEPLHDFRTIPPEDVLQRIDAAGVRGGGGIGFPLAKKIQTGKQHRARLLIINAVECAPYQSADEALVREYAQQVVAGAEILQYASHAERCVIAFQKNKPDALQALKAAMTNSAIELHMAPNSYPAGSEQQLVAAITGKQIPSGSYAAECGVLVINAGAARNSYLAVAEGRPCVSRIITLAGDALRTPKNFDVALGTPVSHLLALCGASENENFTTIVGDTLRSHFLIDRECGIDITSRCIIAAGDNEFPPKPAEAPCIYCGDCHAACPVGLQPDALHRLNAAADIAGLEMAGLRDCFECGACTYSCPSTIDLASSLDAGKKLLATDAAQQDISSHWKNRFEFHQYRLQRDKAEASKVKNSESETKIASDQEQEKFSREKAQLDIAAAVARVKAKRSSPETAEQEKGKPGK